MKKLFKMTSVVLTILMVMTSITAVSVFANAVTTAGKLTVGNGTSYDIDLGVDGATELALTNDNLEVYALSWNDGKCPKQDLTVTSILTAKNAAVAILKLPLPAFNTGKTLDKYILRFSGNASDWTAVQIPGSTLPTFSTTDFEAVKSVCANATAGTTLNQHDFGTVTYSSQGKNVQVYVNTIDVTAYANSCLTAGQSHFFLGLYTTSTKDLYVNNIISGLTDIGGVNYSKDSNMYVYYTEKTASSFEFTGVTEPETANDDLVFTFTNSIDASAVTADMFTITNLAGENEDVQESEITVSGNKIILNKDWEGYGYYEVAFNGEIKDKYNQTLNVSSSTSFEIGVGTTSSTVTPKPLAYICTGNSSDTEGAYDTTASQNAYINGYCRYTIMQFDIDDVVADKQVIGAELSFYCNDGRKFANFNKLACVPEPNFASTSGTDSAYLNTVSGIFGNSSNLIDYTTPGTSSAGRWTADVSEAVSNVILDANKTEKEITFALYLSTGAYQVYGSSHTNKPTLKLKLAGKSLDAISTSPAKGDAMSGVGESIQLTLAAQLADENSIELRKLSNGEAVEIEVSSSGNAYTIDPVYDLDERTEYVVVLKAGATDASGSLSVTGGDKVIHRFTSGTAFVFNEIKFTQEASPEYDNITESMPSYTENSSVTAVTKIFNGSQKNLDAILIVALYNSDGTLNSVIGYDGGTFTAQGGIATQYSKTITVPADAEGTYIKAFVWNNTADIRPVGPHSEIHQAPVVSD